MDQEFNKVEEARQYKKIALMRLSNAVLIEDLNINLENIELNEDI